MVWIRSQDYECLGDYKEFIIKEESLFRENTVFQIHGYSSSETPTFLAEYKTKKRALMVLDGIEYHIVDNKKKILQMPKDKEREK